MRMSPIVMAAPFFEHALQMGFRDWQDKAQLVVHQVPACNPEPLTHTRIEAIWDYDLGVESLVGSMSALCSSG